MAFLKQAKTEDEIKKMTFSNVKKAYNELAKDYMRIVDEEYMLCPKCNDFLSRSNFYTSDEYKSGVFPVCKKCLMNMATDYDKKTNTYTDNRDKTINTLRFMNLPFYESLYSSCIATVTSDVVDKRVANTAWGQMISVIKSLPTYRGKTWADSDIEITSNTIGEFNENSKIVKRAIKRFGSGFTPEDYVFLETEYQDWITRYECSSKAQEEAFERLSFKKWEIRNATKEGRPTKDLDKTYQEWLGTANIQPRQSSGESGSDSQTFGTLIQKYEETRPLPEIDPELQDVDKIGLYIDVFFRGHTCKMFGIKNKFSHLYEKIMSKYTVERPQYKDDDDTESIFDKIFGSMDE